ncbi:Serine carboxypeptidase-like 26 [Heracleum sosnowskyi]|uniref:Serine carboxypeptidase-like 26 n=1 Tax=Heracleum sosnowskyi TaxID=360622 RepID=A0AAD8M1X2_9APIA|nr:Serine carboxypeptidase-like 26 [Heracleum sosnowskyi]
MAMEMKPQSPPTGEFVFDSASTSPYVSCPSSPQRLGNHYFSAPTSPTRAAAFYRDHFLEENDNFATSSKIPFSWEEKKGGPILKNSRKNENIDFEFQLIGQLEVPSISAADELFDGGKIRLLKPPLPELQIDSPKTKNLVSPVEKIKQGDNTVFKETKPRDHDQPKKIKSSSSLERARSDLQNAKHNKSALAWYSKLKLKDLLLFRSISEGHKEKYGMIRKRCNEDVKNSSFRSTESGGSVSSRRRVSAHEWHYTANRAAAEEMRKRTFLPYKRGLLGCLGFHAPVVHELSKGFGSYVMRES